MILKFQVILSIKTLKYLTYMDNCEMTLDLLLFIVIRYQLIILEGKNNGEKTPFSKTFSKKNLKKFFFLFL